MTATEDDKVKAAALLMIERPLDLIKSVLLKHEEAAIDVMRTLHRQQQWDTALLRQALDALEFIPHSGSVLGAAAEAKRVQAIAALRERLGEKT